MKSPPFEYFAPRSLDEALALLHEHGDEAKVLAGGQSLIPILALRLAHPAVLVDIGGIDTLGEIARNGSLTIGASVTQRRAERSAEVAAASALLAETLPQIAHPQIRNRGTVGGSLAHADPAAELPAVMLALDAVMTIRGPGGTRSVAAADFFRSYLETAVGVDEMLVDVRVPIPSATGVGSSFQEISRRHGDFALAGAATQVELDTDGRVRRASIAFCGVASTPVRAGAATAALVGRVLDKPTIDEIARLAATDLDPPSDVHATGAYRKHIAGVLASRTLTVANERARSGAGARAALQSGERGTK
ncbi:MAG TPA: xanthine dehydrogenase family protein subunit M [Acidimicrobiales bacterium]|nr:xanthine dehydrogenase family protein subunit M [Acidimicrobiales bacterium]